MPSFRNLALIVAAATLAGCDGRARRSGFSRPLVLVVSGDTAGWLVPCGCASNQSGGLLRRGSYAAALRTQGDVILADAGGAPAGTSAYDRLKFEAILRGEAAMGVAAHNLGAAEVALGAAELRRLAEATGITWTSANVRDGDGRLVGKPFVRVAGGGGRLAMIGVLSERLAAGELRASPPRQAVLEALRDANERCDAIVVLAYLAEDELRQLAETLPEADVIVGGPTGQPLRPAYVGPTLLVSATRQGKFLARLDAPTTPAGRWTGRIEELDQRFPDDPDQAANLRRFYKTLEQRDVSARDTGFAPPLAGDFPAGFAVAGSASCRECHPHDCLAWDGSRHAAAWRSLQAKGAHVDPECQRCHTTGYGLPGGFLSAARTPDRAGVGCESCHGPSRGHVVEPKVRTAYFEQTENHCGSCHDRENSPEFLYAKYWPKIQHGEAKAVMRAPGGAR